MHMTEFQPTSAYQGAEAGLGDWAERQASLDGFSRIQKSKNVRQQQRVSEAARLYADVLAGKEPPTLLKEAMNPSWAPAVQYLQEKYPKLYAANDRVGLRETMSVTDYQALYVDVLDRMYYGFYNAYPIDNMALVRRHTLRDFRLVSRYLLDGAVTPFTAMDAAAPPPQAALFGPAPQNGAIPSTAATSTAPIQYQPKLYQSMTSVNWRAFVNDDLGIFQDLSNRLAIRGARGTAKFITTQYVDVNGPSATLYQTGYKNQIITANGAASNNPVLSTQGLMDALKILARQVDSTGDPILITGRLKLVFGPALLATANNVMNMMSVFLQNEGGTTNVQGFPTQFVQTSNWIVQNMDLIMDPYMRIVASSASATIQEQQWMLFVDQASLNRPQIEFGQLQGFETPQIFTRVPNTQRMGGGVDAMMGQFDTMDSDMKIVGVMGATVIDGRPTVASNGSAS